MTKTIKILVSLLAIQAVLLFWVNKSSSGTVIDKNKSLITVDFSTVDKVLISEGEKDSCELVKKEGVWSLPAYYGFPASAEKTEHLFTALGALKYSWPAGKTLLAAKQFLTTDEKFEKKFDIYKADELVTTVYIGNSPSFKKIHLRVEGDENTYVGAFSSYEYPAKPESWANKALYKISKSDLLSFQKGSLELLASEEGKSFQWSDLKASEKMDFSQTNLIINTAIHPDFQKVLGKGSYKLGSKVLSYTLEKKSGGSVQYDFYKRLKEEKKSDKKEDSEEEDSLVLKVSTQPYYFEVARSEVRDIIKLERKLLLSLVPSHKDKEVTLKGKPSQ